MADTKTTKRTKTPAHLDPENLFNQPLPDWLDKMLDEIIAAETTDSAPAPSAQNDHVDDIPAE